MEDIAAARLSMEQVMTTEAIGGGDPDRESGIVAAFHRLRQIDPDQPDHDARQRWRQAHDGFHRALLAAARSVRLRQFYDDLIKEMQRYHDHAIYTPGHATDRADLLREVHSLASHRALHDAFLARDTDRARRLMQEHVSHTLDVYRSATRAKTAGTGKEEHNDKKD